MVNIKYLNIRKGGGGESLTFNYRPFHTSCSNQNRLLSNNMLINLIYTGLLVADHKVKVKKKFFVEKTFFCMSSLRGYVSKYVLYT